MMRVGLVAVLLVAVIGSAMAVVVLKHDARKAFGQLQASNETRDQAMTEWSRLQLELASLAELGRIEQTATTTLNMTPPERTQVVIQQPMGQATNTTIDSDQRAVTDQEPR